MISAKLIELIQTHATPIATDVASDLVANERTRGFRAVKREQLEGRVYTIVHSLGTWIAAPHSQAVRDEFGEWGAKRFGEGIPLNEVVYAVIVLKSHLRRYIREHGLLDAAFPRAEADYILPMHLHSLQELTAQVTDFFDEALYSLALGYEQRSAGIVAAPR